MERFIYWSLPIKDFQQKRINYEEREAQLEVAALHDKILQDQHREHLTHGKFHFDKHILEKLQHRLHQLDQDKQQLIANITSLTVQAE